MQRWSTISNGLCESLQGCISLRVSRFCNSPLIDVKRVGKGLLCWAVEAVGDSVAVGFEESLVSENILCPGPGKLSCQHPVTCGSQAHQWRLNPSLMDHGSWIKCGGSFGRRKLSYVQSVSQFWISAHCCEMSSMLEALLGCDHCGALFRPNSLFVLQNLRGPLRRPFWRVTRITDISRHFL